MKTFPFIKIEGKKYPTVIMGEDKFTGWFGKDRFTSEKERAKAYLECLEMAYSNGVRGFSISPQKTLVKTLTEFKQKNLDIVCISNHHWKSHYYMGEESMWSEEKLSKLFRTVNGAEDSFSKEEIQKIILDEKEYSEIIKKHVEFCDFGLVGNLGISALVILDRQDIIKKEIEIARELGMIPLGMCEAGVIIDDMEKLNVAGTWMMINRHQAFPDLDTVVAKLKHVKKPVTAYRVFKSPERFDLAKSVNFIKDNSAIKSIVVGVENKEQAQETFSKLHEFWP